MFEFKKERGIFACLVIVFVIAGVLIAAALVSTYEASAASKKIYIKNVSSGAILKIGKTRKIRYGTAKEYKNKKVGFKSSNKKIAAVNGKGIIKGKKNGKAKITIFVKKDKSVKSTITICVMKNPKWVKSIKITGNYTLVKGTSSRLKAKALPSNASNRKVKWKSSKSSVVMVSAGGKLTAKNTGTAKITAIAKDGSGVSKTVKVRVIRLKSRFTRFIAHRGYHIRYKENTAAAFKAAGSRNFWGCECDIWETAKNADGEFDIVINHDNNFERVFGYKGRPYKMTAEKIQKEIPKACFLDEYLQICKETGMVPVIEIKYDYDNKRAMSNAGIVRVLYKVHEAGLLKKAHFISFHPGTLVRLKKKAASRYNANPYTAYLMSDSFLKKNQKAKKPDYIKAINTAAKNKFSSVSFKKSELTEERATACKKKGLKIETWTFNKGDANLVYKQVKKLKAACITTNVKYWQ